MSMQAVPLAKAYRLLNHGPTVLVSAAADGRRNLMAAAWCMPLDFEPPKLLVVLDKATYTRELIERSGEFVINVPPRRMLDITVAAGNRSGREGDKFVELGVAAEPSQRVAAPSVAGCIAWLECVLLPEAHNQSRYDLFIGEVVAARADERVFSDGRWHFDPQDDALRTLHHVAGGAFFAIGEALDG
jgi:flavin reductase (DIM6/NTAB) family NADH-FMN oxidoreductase RutF